MLAKAIARIANVLALVCWLFAVLILLRPETFFALKTAFMMVTITGGVICACGIMRNYEAFTNNPNLWLSPYNFLAGLFGILAAVVIVFAFVGNDSNYRLDILLIMGIIAAKSIIVSLHDKTGNVSRK